MIHAFKLTGTIYVEAEDAAAALRALNARIGAAIRLGSLALLDDFSSDSGHIIAKDVVIMDEQGERLSGGTY